jgi:hypothetical protein
VKRDVEIDDDGTDAKTDSQTDTGTGTAQTQMKIPKTGTHIHLWSTLKLRSSRSNPNPFRILSKAWKCKYSANAPFAALLARSPPSLAAPTRRSPRPCVSSSPRPPAAFAMSARYWCRRVSRGKGPTTKSFNCDPETRAQHCGQDCAAAR